MPPVASQPPNPEVNDAIMQRNHWLLLAAALADFSLRSPVRPPRPDPPISIDPQDGRGELEVRFKGRKLLVYAFATNQFKPYVRELYTLRGENVLRDAAPDHLHHHGLMYAVCVNGINFWEERNAPGIQKHVEMLHVDTCERATACRWRSSPS